MQIVKWTILIIAYAVAVAYAIILAQPTIECIQHHCYGPDYDIFVLPFFLSPIGGVAALITLPNAMQQIKKRQPWSLVFWPLAAVSASILAFMAFVIIATIFQNMVRGY